MEAAQGVAAHRAALQMAAHPEAERVVVAMEGVEAVVERGAAPPRVVALGVAVC